MTRGERQMTTRTTRAQPAPHAEARRWATIAQACEYSTLSRNTVNRLVNNRALTRWKVGRKVLIDLSELDRAIEGGAQL